MSFYDNFLKLCNKAGKSPSKVLLEIGGTKSAVTRWKKGGMPTDATAQKIAGYFGVTVDDLMNGDILWLTAKDNKLTNALELMANTAASNAVDRTFSTGQKEKPLVNDDEELTEYLEMLRTRPECRMFFSLAKGATKEDVEKAVAIVEALRKAEGRM